eukprot:TRINITY_DN8615_c0_g1_i1.p1 TRINITY_DN8615_c0_g1~~TRINITY_DN8615_c0_g1_i1.p1  ORF type:complete len:68 (+),score=1.91 TRINITY_DN8615_c0_g1_i1:122-325(+)
MYYFETPISRGLWKASYAVSANASSSELAFTGVTQFITTDCSSFSDALPETFFLGMHVPMERGTRHC